MATIESLGLNLPRRIWATASKGSSGGFKGSQLGSIRRLSRDCLPSQNRSRVWQQDEQGSNGTATKLHAEANLGVVCAIRGSLMRHKHQPQFRDNQIVCEFERMVMNAEERLQNRRM